MSATCLCLYPPDVDGGAWVSDACPVHMRDWAGNVYDVTVPETAPDVGR